MNHQGNASPEMVREKNEEWKKAYLEWTKHREQAEERDKFKKFTEEFLNPSAQLLERLTQVPGTFCIH